MTKRVIVDYCDGEYSLHEAEPDTGATAYVIEDFEWELYKAHLKVCTAWHVRLRSISNQICDREIEIAEQNHMAKVMPLNEELREFGEDAGC